MMSDQRKKEDRDWAALLEDIVDMFAGRVDCNVDRANMAMQCQSWRDTVDSLPERIQLPWMLVPYRRSSFMPHNVMMRGLFYCFLSGRAHCMPMPANAYDARFIGSYEGGWVVLAARHNSGYVVVHCPTNHSIPFPRVVLLRGCPVSDEFVLRACAFSCSPSVAANCVVASLVTSFDCSLNHRTLVAFHRFGASAMSSGSVLEAEDIIYYRGSFYCLTMIEDMIRCTPRFSQDDPPDTLVVRKTYLHFAPIHHDEGLVVKARYLVESRGQLLMVVRFKSVTSEDTSMFAFFQMVPDGPGDGVYFVWQRLPATGGRMIFVGHGASRCFEASVYPSCKEGVYYFDDETFNQPAMVAFGFSNGRSYTCHDNGYWPGPEGEIKRSYDWRVPSSYTPPIWFLP
ncbi:unnamed protein product [Urochloa decumbens]|uniref:KIB1-4 beta-propeller domain-containing protein n=1 Tax=Urochloa decumbens TaxID=240449 RepID=A0ABC9ATE0_9POAL